MGKRNLLLSLVLGACFFFSSSSSLVSATQCTTDDCLRALFPTSSPAVYFYDVFVCAIYTAHVHKKPTGFIPRASSACGKDPARYSSACSCRRPMPTTMTTKTSTTKTQTVTPTTKTSTSTTPPVSPINSATPTVSPSTSATPTVSPSTSATPTVSPSTSATPTVSPSTSTTSTLSIHCTPSPTDHAVSNGGFECGLNPWIAADIPNSQHTLVSPGDASPFAYEYAQIGPVTDDNYQRPGSVNQDLTVTINQAYVLRFRTYFDKCTPSEGFVGVMLNHQPVYTVDACDFGAGAFKDNTVYFTPTVSPFNLRFEFIIAENPAQARVDNVVVVPV